MPARLPPRSFLAGRASAECLCRRASSITARSGPGTTSSSVTGNRPDPISVLPPLLLYRKLLRLHRKVLDCGMRSLGDAYVKDEFRRCRNVQNPVQIVGFLSQWNAYHETLQSQLAARQHPRESTAGIGKKLPEDLLDKLSSEQVGQLFELLKATKEIHVTDEG